MRPLATPWLAMAMTEQNRLDEAEQTLANAQLLGPVPPSVLFTVALGSRGRLRLAQHDLEPAIDDLRALLDRNAARDQQRVEPPWQPLLAEALALASRTSEAAGHARTYKALASEWKTNRALGHAARMTALISPRAKAITLLEQACKSFAASHARLELARASVELGAHRRANGDRRQARSILRDAHDLAFACPRPCALRPRASRAAPRRRAPPPDRQRRTRHPDCSRATHRRNRDPRRHQSRNRPPAIPVDQNRGDAPAQHLPQARHHRPPPTQRRPPARPPTRRLKHWLTTRARDRYADEAFRREPPDCRKRTELSDAGVPATSPAPVRSQQGGQSIAPQPGAAEARCVPRLTHGPDKSQKRAAAVAALLLGHRSSHERADQLTAAPGVMRSRVPARERGRFIALAAVLVRLPLVDGRVAVALPP
jgi:tetratricopeptide (TPR) repeat protein